MDFHRLITECTGFDWDVFNIRKNLEKHRVPWWECEEVFLNEPILLLDDILHSQSEKRYYALGVTIDRRRLFVAFTIRSNKIRPISARDMSRKERRIYEESEIETDPEI
jgi:uncharacterized DUF497 family protein